MTILSRIIKEAATTAISSQEHLGMTTAQSLDFAVQAIQNNNPQALINELMKTEKVGYAVARVMLTSGRKLNQQAQWEIKKMLRLMDGDYYFYNHCQQVVVFKYGDLFIEQIRHLQKNGVPLNPLEQADLFIKTRDIFKSYCNFDIDAKYWNLRDDLEDNLRAVGINDKLIMDLYLNKLGVAFQYTDHLNDVWNRRYISNLFKADQRAKLLQHLVWWIKDTSSDESALGGTFLSIAYRLSGDSTYMEWTSYPGMDKVKFAFWLMRYKSWYADSTAEFNDKLGVYINYTHHELVEHCFHNPTLLPETFSYKDHPKDIYAKAIPHLMAAKIVQLYGQRQGICRTYPIPVPHFSNLPRYWEYIGTEFRQISEGQLMRHCCGGEGYLRKRENNYSIFFHVTTDEPHGLTVELTKGDISVAEQQYHYTHQERFCKLDNIDNFVFSTDTTFVTYRIEQVKGYRNRQPTEKEMLKLRCELFGISNNEVLLPRETMMSHYVIPLDSNGDLQDQWTLFDPRICFLMSEAVLDNCKLYMIEKGRFDETIREKREWVKLDKAIVDAGGEVGNYAMDSKVKNLPPSPVLTADIEAQRRADYQRIVGGMVEMQMRGIMDTAPIHQVTDEGLVRTRQMRIADAHSRRSRVRIGTHRIRTDNLPDLYNDPLWQEIVLQTEAIAQLASGRMAESFLSVTNADEQFEDEIEELSTVTNALEQINFGWGMNRERKPITSEERESLQSIFHVWQAMGIAKDTALCRLVKTADILENAAIANKESSCGKGFSGIINPTMTTYLNLSKGE